MIRSMQQSLQRGQCKMTRYFLSSVIYEDKGFCLFLQNHLNGELKRLITENFDDEELKNIEFNIKVVETSSGIYAVFYNSHTLVLSDRGSPSSKIKPRRFLTKFFQNYSKKIRRLYRLYVSLQ